MDLTETIDFEHQRRAICSCAGPSLQEDAPTRVAVDCDGESSSWCPICNLSMRHFGDSIDNISELLDEGVFESSRSYVPDALIGKQLSEFVIQERIGSGGMARVYLAHDTILQRFVALKVIQNRKFVTNESQASVLKSEAISQAQLHHQNVVSIFYVGNHEGLPFLAMEYVDGCSLADRLKEDGSISFRETLDFAEQIVAGLCEAYEHGLIHGDIKPANLLVADDGTLKLSDFGLARRAEEKSEISKKLIGTPSFMAPELFANHPIDQQTDLFSLGVTLFQLTFGRAPYLLMGETAEEVKHEIEISEIDFPKKWPSDVPVKWKALLEKLLEKDRSKRFHSIGEVQAEITELSKPVLTVKPVTKVSAFLSENLLYFFLAIPFLNTMVHLDSNANWTSVPWSYLWFLGPLSLFAMSVIHFQSLIQSVFQIQLSIDQKLSRRHVRFMWSYALQLAPVAIFLVGVLLIPFIGLVAAAWSLKIALVVGLLQILDTILQIRSANEPNRPRLTFVERWGRCRIVVDSSVYQNES